MDELDRIFGILGNSALAVAPADFPHDPVITAQPGLYAWWADDEAVAALSTALKNEVQPLVYLGQAGGTKWPSGRQNRRTIADRILKDELGNGLAGATFRVSLAAILREPLDLRLVAAMRLREGDGKRLTAWMFDHLRVVVCAYPDRNSLESIKQKLLPRLDPPLNLEGNVERSRIRERLSELRQAVNRGE